MQPHLETRMDSEQGSFTESVSSLLERKVRGWLTGVIDDMRRSGPVQQWLDSLPPDAEPAADKPPPESTEATDTVIKQPEQAHTDIDKDAEQKHDDSCLDVPNSQDTGKRKSLESGVLPNIPYKDPGKKLQRDYSIQSEGCSPKPKNPLLRDYSLQSDASGSSGSSVLNVLGARKVDAESVLLALGFGPSEKQQKLQRIPDRFLQPSKLKGISTEQFIKDEQHSMRMHDCGIFGYRGLTGNPHVPPSTIVAKIMERILQDDLCREQASLKARHSVADIRSATAHARRPQPLTRRDT